MKNLNKNFLETYNEAVKSIELENKSFRLCRFYQIERLTNETFHNAYKITSNLISVKVKKDGQQYEKDFVNGLTENAVLYGADIEEFINKKLKAKTKSVFLYMKEKQLNEAINKSITAYNNEECVEFDTVKEAAIHLGLSPKSTKGIYNAIKTGKNYKGYAWTKNF